MNRATLATVALLAVLAPAAAFAESRPVTPSDGGTNLQVQLDSMNPGLNAVTSQVDIQRWQKSLTGNSALTLQIELTDAGTSNEIGVYSAIYPFTRYPIFLDSALPGWFAAASFHTDGTLDVNVWEGVTLKNTFHYSDVNYESFGFYIKNGSNLGFSQDVLNPGEKARAVVIPGTGINVGDKFICFEDGKLPDDGTEKSDFDDAIIVVNSMSPATAVSKATWAAVKRRFR